MDPQRFDRITRLFADRKLSRRQAIASAGAGITAGAIAATGLQHAAAQDATPAAATDATGEKTTYLFVQTFQSGTIAPTEGVEGRYTVALERSTGQTIYFGDRPSRDVGVAGTPEFLEGLGFTEDNPPNAALIVETEPGETDIAVVELFNPTYDPVTSGVTYEVEVLENWQEDLELGLREEPADLAALIPDFGAASLFIDDCADGNIVCVQAGGGPAVGWFNDVGYCWAWDKFACVPCESGTDSCPSCIVSYWADKCNSTYDGCNGNCAPSGPYLS